MTWSQELQWQGYQLSLTRGETSIEDNAAFPKPAPPDTAEIRFPALMLIFGDEYVHLDGEVNGKTIARVYLEVFWEAQDGWRAGPVYQCELDAPAVREVSGVEIPVWEESSLVSATWQPRIHLLICGEDGAWVFPQPSLSNPQSLWLHAEWVSGDSSHPVRLHFSSEGRFDRMTSTGSPITFSPGSRGLFPHPRDQIIPSYTWMRHQEVHPQTAPGSSNTLSITGQPPRLETIPAPPGRYCANLRVLDLDGQAWRSNAIPFTIHQDGSLGLDKG